LGLQPRNSSSRRKTWDEEHVIKRKFSALIPAFDPRPGRTNINQTSDLDIALPAVPSLNSEVDAGQTLQENNIIEASRTSPERGDVPRLQLCLRGPNMPGVTDVEIDLNNLDSSIFKAVQQCVQTSSLGNKGDKIRRIWEPTYVIVYKEVKEKSPTGSELNDSTSSNNSHHCSMDEVLQLLRQLFIVTTKKDNVHIEAFNSKRITNKLVQQIQDSLILASNALPDWCHELTSSCPMVFPFETRLLYFQCTAFGASRSIVWLQNQRDQNLERARGSLRRDEVHEFRVGRIKHERVKVPRGDQLLDWAMQVMKTHAERKSILEVEFIDEEGTGLGPTLEFFALVAAELQRKDLAIWLCDDDLISLEEECSVISDAKKPPGYYVSRPSGLFPAPLPQDSDICNKAVKIFRFLGIFLAKTLQDNRLVDLPLSNPLLKLICQGEISRQVKKQSDELMATSMLSVLSEESTDLDSSGGSSLPLDSSESWFADILNVDDLVEIDPNRGQFLVKLQELVNEKHNILNEEDLDKLSLNMNGDIVKLEDLGLTFQYSPSSRIFGLDEGINLIPDGDNELVTIHNVEDYLSLTLDLALNKGIKKQMDAFRAGFNQVFPIEKLAPFSPFEVKSMLCGDQSPVFTKEDIIKFTDPKLGYTRESPAFLKFVNVLVDFTDAERKAFLQFTTGCSSLPPGGLANLYPRLTIVRKIDAGDGSYPSVNTCVHYLKLPDYSTEEVMREKLLAATSEKGFHLN